ncbi:MAG: hypothetical protein RIG68_23715 [Imperialibacter sp.]|uniref:hypothetical protein n=1 Tax=Imperialibacter sp. TaxID=2038411 RepID=UPI0032ECEBFE
MEAIYIAYTISNVVGLFFLLVTIKWPKLARLLFVLLFAGASWFNYITCHTTPEAYLMYAESSVLECYKVFITGWFSQHITAVVSIIAIGQAMIAIGMLLNNWWIKLASSGIILFLACIAPFGIYSAFPFSVTVSLSAWFILKKDNLDYLWKFRSPGTSPNSG